MPKYAIMMENMQKICKYMQKYAKQYLQQYALH